MMISRLIFGTILEMSFGNYFGNYVGDKFGDNFRTISLTILRTISGNFGDNSLTLVILGMHGY